MIPTYTRHYVEAKGKFGAGIIDQTEHWYLAKVLNDLLIYCHKEDGSVTPSLINEGFWEAWITAWLFNTVKPGTVFFDVGANTGYYSFLAEYLGAQVHAFEPNPKYVEMLNATKELNESRVRISQMALSDRNGEATLHIPKTLHGSASLGEIPGYEVDEIAVQTRRLDTYRPGAGKHLIKIDAEGAEEKILHGAKGFLDQLMIPATIMLEYTPHAYSGKFLDELFSNYKVHWINYDGLDEPVNREWISQRTDWVMLVLRRNF